MARITISDISLEQDYLTDLSEIESALVNGGIGLNELLLGLAALATLFAFKKVDAITTITLFGIDAIARL